MTVETAVPDLAEQSKAKVFISYSRKDIGFADRLETSLAARGSEPLMDRSEIYAFEEWWTRIEALIAHADTVVFVLSPDSVASDVALKEVAYAASLNKRFAPIVCRRVSDEMVPEALAKLNFIFFDDEGRFDASADRLAEALTTDIGWIRRHTEFGAAARRWSAASRPGGLLLRSPMLEEAERWIASRPRGAPEPTEETRTFAAESRRGAGRRRNILTGSLTAGLLVALALAGLAYWQRGIAVEQQTVARQQRNVAESRRIATLAELATGERLLGNWETALRLGVHAARLALGLDRNAAEISAPALAAAVARSPWRVMLAGHEGPLHSAAFSPDGARIVTASDDCTARVWDAATGREITVLRGHEEAVWSAAFSPDGSRIVTASWDRTARIWDATTGKELAVLRGHNDTVWFAAFSPDGARIVTASQDKTARIWGLSEGSVVRAWVGLQIQSITPDVVLARGLTIAVGALVTGTLPNSPAVEAEIQTEDVITSINDAPVHDAIEFAKRIGSMSPGTSVKLGLMRQRQEKTLTLVLGTLRVPATTVEQLAVLRGHKGGVHSAAFGLDGGLIVTASFDNTARIWDAASGDELTVLRGREHILTSAALSPDGSRIVTASGSRLSYSDKTARIWDTATGKEIAVLHGHEGYVTSAAFSPDGSHIATASGDHTARIWDAATGKEITVLRVEDYVKSAAFTPNGARIVTKGGVKRDGKNPRRRHRQRNYGAARKRGRRRWGVVPRLQP